MTAGSFDIAAIRDQFPILATRVNGNPLHYLDNAATTQVPRAVLDAVTEHETTRRANVMRSVHYLAEAATEAFEAARETMAEFIGAAAPEEVIFTSGTTGGINLVAHSFGSTLKPCDEIVISLLEHHSNIVPWQQLRDRCGIVLKFLPVTDDGRIDIAALPDLITERCRLVAVSHASNVTGAVADIAAISSAARSIGAYILLDGAQFAAHGPLDVKALDVDFYALSSHKMFGPNGVGVLWGREELLAEMPPFLGGGEMIRTVTPEQTIYADLPHKFEAGTPPIAQAVGMAAAATWISELDPDARHQHLDKLCRRLGDGLQSLNQKRDLIRIIGPAPGSALRLPVVSFLVGNAHPHDICQILDRHGVALRGGHHCAQPLMTHFGVTGTSRASMSLYNNNSDIDGFLNGMNDVIEMLAAR